jgi:fucose 4-O-acetylase-like acetyltransferase
MNTAVHAKQPFRSEFHMLRGIAVLLVVLCHAWEPLQYGSFFRTIVWITFSIPMPLFFFISGFFGVKFFIVKERSWKKMGAHQFKRLMSVYLFCSVIVSIIKMPMQQWADRPEHIGNLLINIILYPGRNPMIILWFLYVLFFMEMAFFCFNSLFKCDYQRRSTVCLCFVVLYGLHIFSHYSSVEILGLGFFTDNAIFFYLGFLCNQKYEQYAAYLMPFRYWIILGTGLYLLYPFVVSIGWAKLPFNILSIVIAWAVAERIQSTPGKIRWFFEMLANNAYGIYAYSFFFQVPIRILFLRVLPGHDILFAASSFLAGLLLPPILVRYVLTRHIFLRRWALGDWSAVDRQETSIHAFREAARTEDELRTAASQDQ